MKKSNRLKYNKYSEINWNNIKNTWKRIKSLISLKFLASSAPTVLSCDNGNSITNPYNIAHTFNNYFASIAETTKSKMKYSHKHFSDYLKEECDSTMFLKPTSKEEIVTSYPLLNLLRLLAQIVYLIEFYFFLKMKFQCNWQICSTFLL